MTFTQSTKEGTTVVRCDACRAVRYFRNPLTLRKWKDAHAWCKGVTP